jgi:hypothetical protein
VIVSSDWSRREEGARMTAQIVAIVVRGRLGRDLVAALDGFVVEETPEGLTRVTGPVPDQSKLFGVLGMFDALHIEVVSVNPVVGV